MPSPLVELSALGVRFGRTPVLRDLSLVVEPGTSICVVGPNGSGKTTLLRVVATLTSPSHGSGFALGARLGTGGVYPVRQAIGLIGHTPALYPQLTLGENLEFVARAAGVQRERVEWALGLVGLTGASRRRVEHASWGMQRRVEFARLLMTEPRLVLLDEPHSGLDAQAGDLVRLVVRQVLGRQGAAVMASHHPEPLAPLADRMYRLEGGALSLMSQVPA